MKRKKQFGFLSLFISFCFLSVSFKPIILGGVINAAELVSIKFFIGLVFLFLAMILLGLAEEVVKRRPLSYKKDRPSDTYDKLKGIVKRIIGA